jgi:phage major head subunit gpT-like protein
MMVRGQFAQTLAPGVHHWFLHFLDLQMRDEEYTHFMNIETSEQAFEDEVEMAGVGAMPEKPEGSATIYDDMVQGGTKRYLHLTYSLGSRITWELIEDDQYGILRQVPKAHSRSAMFAREQVAANVLNLGFSTVTTTDGLSLFNTSHPLLGGVAATNLAPGVTNVISASGTYPNRPSPDVDLSFTGIQLMVNQFERMPDSQGIPVRVKPACILIPPELKFIAREILGSPGKPYTNDNELNSIIGEDLKFRVLHYITSQSTWFGVATKDSHQMKFFDRHPIDTDYDDDFDTRSTKMMTFQRFSAGATSWVGTWGSNGP